MASYNFGKDQVVTWLKRNFNQGDTCLDVGACDGKYYNLVGNYFKMDAVEIFKQNIDSHHLTEKYNQVFNCDVADLEYDYYDCIIFGDVIEHMTIENAQKVLEYAKPRCKDLIIAVPYLYKQGPLYGNKWEEHIQNDLTPENFIERYGEYDIIWQAGNYCYYCKKK